MIVPTSSVSAREKWNWQQAVGLEEYEGWYMGHSDLPPLGRERRRLH
jgi:hypothetical protein